MSFYTALTGLNAATASLGVISNNIANVGTTGFKKSRADFGDIFATSPLQRASSVIGQGVALKAVTQEFSQGNLQFSANSLDIAITGDGFFPLKSADGLQDVYTRNGTFLLDDSFAVVNSAGQALMAASVDSSGKADLETLRKLIIPRSTNGDARETTAIELGLNLPADAEVITATFDPTDPDTYNLTTAVTVFDAGGNEYLATVYYVKTQRASPEDPSNKWQTHVYIGDTKLDELLIQASDNDSEPLYVNKYGQVKPENEIPPQDIARGVTKLFNLDKLTDKSNSERAQYEGTELDPLRVEELKTGTFSVSTALDRTATVGGVDVEYYGWNDSVSGNKELYFDLNIDNSPSSVRVDLSELYSSTSNYSGVDLARFLEAKINKAYGDQRFFDLSVTQSDPDDVATDPATQLNFFDVRFVSRDGSEVEQSFSATVGQIDALLQAAVLESRIQDYEKVDTDGDDVGDIVDISKLTTDDLNFIAQNLAGMVDYDGTSQLTVGGTDLALLTIGAAAAAYTDDPVAGSSLADYLTVSYDPAKQNFIFDTLSGGSVSVKAFGDDVSNALFDLTSSFKAVDPDSQTYSGIVWPNGDTVRTSNLNYDDSDQRYGIQVEFDDTTRAFIIKSGTTGDDASVTIAGATLLAGDIDPTTGETLTESREATNADLTAALLALRADAAAVVTADDVPDSLRAFLNFQEVFNFPIGETTIELLPTRGVRSTPAVVTGTPIGLNLDNKFTLSAETNTFTVTVDNVTGLIQLPTGVEYTSETFRQALEDRINALEDSRGRTVNGVSVQYKTVGNAVVLEVSTGTEGNDSFLKVTGPSIWGLTDLASGRGTTEQWLVPPQAENINGVPLYVDRDGNETTEAGDFSEEETRELWSPIFLDKGELTFNTRGELQSPAVPIGFKATTIGQTGATLQFSINYDGTTQYSSPFSVVAQNQNGQPEGDLIGLDIGDDGLCSANYSNGNQKNLAKIVLANFAAPTGLRQIGDASFYATSKSGSVSYGEAGTAGFGTIRAGARERANVDLTQELIDLITAQRAFQANAKAIETNNTLTQAIINIRS